MRPIANMTKVRQICELAIEMIKRYESFVDHLYICPGGYWTIGWGHLVSNEEELVYYQQKGTITEDEGEELLLKDLIVAELGVMKYISVPLSDLQYGALVSFTMNLGTGALQRSTLRSKLNRGDYGGASGEFERWVYAGGRKLLGLVRRRREEKEMFLAGTSEGNGCEDNGV